MSLIRGTSLQGFSELVVELGGDPEALLRDAHLPPAAIGDHDSFVSYRGVVTVLEAAAAATGAEDFGRRLALRQGLDILGPLGVAARTAASVGAALAAIEQYMAVYSPAIAVRVAAPPDERLAHFEWRIVADRPPPHRQSAELALGVSVRVFRLLAGDDFRPVTVQLRHEQPTVATAHGDYFGCPVRFGEPGYGFSFHRTTLERPLSSDSSVHAVVRDYLGSIAPPAEAGTEPVVRLIRRMLATGGPDLRLVADQLALHPRTLQRQLSGRGTSFATLVDEVRREEAERYLRETAMPLSQLAGVLGFSEQSALSRASRRWFGTSPTEVRRGNVTAPLG
ncbi:AraC family transcriptional regulator [Nocardioides silvaticus]|uniref:AraC family transcriptional regulator n=1 Tax=Nocardioides silvaticus TaxID=2201891 RepID=UPI001474E78C|nr:AraC family transcriptional regulator [Nocardioides silvaticus]